VVPLPPNNSFASFKLLTSVQFDPFQVSVFAVCGGTLPPKAKAEVLLVPAPAT
jgi:hypothetical protein